MEKEGCEQATNQAGACGILLHQRPILADVQSFGEPLNLLFFETWFGTPDEEISDSVLEQATVELEGKNLLFLKAVVDGSPEIINVELDAGEFLTATTLRSVPPVICVHATNEPDSEFHLRRASEVRILAAIRGWRLRSTVNPARIGRPVAPAPGTAI